MCFVHFEKMSREGLRMYMKEYKRREDNKINHDLLTLSVQLYYLTRA